VLKLACAYVGGDPNVAEASRLMRLPGSHNTREEGEALLARIIHVDDLSCELDDLLDFFLEARPILPRPVKQGKANGHARAEAFESNDGPVDVEAWFAAMAYKARTTVSTRLKKKSSRHCCCKASTQTTCMTASSAKLWGWRRKPG